MQFARPETQYIVFGAEGMAFEIRTDLAVEARELHTDRLPDGIIQYSRLLFGYPATEVQIETEDASDETSGEDADRKSTRLNSSH